jgi:Glutamyl- and glutaminyl-tRNA synthetases
MKIHEFGKFSKSSIKKGIDEGIYDGWDDPRLPTILAMRKRGISPEAIRNFMIKLGVGNSDISISMKNIYAENRKIIDPKVNRYFFVCDPIELEVKGVEERTARVPLHPNFPERGVRELKVKDRILIARKDYESFQEKVPPSG